MPSSPGFHALSHEQKTNQINLSGELHPRRLKVGRWQRDSGKKVEIFVNTKDERGKEIHLTSHGPTTKGGRAGEKIKERKVPNAGTGPLVEGDAAD